MNKRKKRFSATNEQVSELGKLQPQNVELEEAVLGAALLEREGVEAIINIITPECFYKEQNANVYRAITNLYKASQPIDILTVTQELKRMELLESIGGSYYVSSLTNRIASSANIEYHARIVLQCYLKRELIRTSTENIKQAYDDTTDVFDVYAEGIHQMENNLQSVMKYEASSIGDIHTNLQARAMEIATTGKASGVPSQLRSLDRLTNGWQKTELIIIAGRPGMGKAQPYFSKVLTPSGFKPMEQIQVGDTIINSDGLTTTVTGKYPQGIKKYYKISFSDDTYTHCCEEHLWLTKTRKERKSNKPPSVRCTKDIIKSLRVNNDQRLNHSIEYIKPVCFTKKELLIHPYLLGVILGDFNCPSMRIMNPEPDIIKKVKQLLPRTDKLNILKSKNTFSIVNKTKGHSISGTSYDLSTLKLKKCLAHQKFIPKIYLHSSEKQRIELLQGLIDTDGYVVNENQIEYSTTSQQLALDIRFLVLSLGGRCTFKKKQGSYKKNGIRKTTRVYYRMNISFNNGIIPVSSNKHLKRYGQGKKRIIYKYISNIEFVDKAECYCISVSANNHLYVTDDFILTHNTAVALNIALRPAMELNIPVAIFSLEMSKEQLGGRVQSIVSGINATRIIKNQHGEAEIKHIESKAKKIYTAPVYIDDTPGLTLIDLKSKARKLKAKNKIELIIIDYLQLMSGTNEKNGNREQEISGISRGLKSLAKELQIPIIALSQLSRQVENRGQNGHKPQLSDLRESGAIEQDADMVIFTYRPIYYQMEEYQVENDILPAKELLSLIIAKHRNGPLGEVILGFKDETMTVTNWDWANKCPEHEPVNTIDSQKKPDNLVNQKESCIFVQQKQGENTQVTGKMEDNTDFLNQKSEDNGNF